MGGYDRRMTRLLFIVGALAALAVPGIPLIAVYIDKKMSKDVYLLSNAADEGMVELNRSFWEPGQPVAAIYGQPTDKRIRVVRPDPARTIVPREDPSLTLLRVDSTYHPLQLQTVAYFAKWCTVANAAVALVCFLAAMVRTRVRPVAPPGA
ncbi:MAG: hypothetical protein FD180_2364 [Planctomycetota bacterium]|nr:MAG: hypothetical protein FD180_2364 [Planctomycetota bacterium]